MPQRVTICELVSGPELYNGHRVIVSARAETDHIHYTSLVDDQCTGTTVGLAWRLKAKNHESVVLLDSLYGKSRRVGANIEATMEGVFGQDRATRRRWIDVARVKSVRITDKSRSR